ERGILGEVKLSLQHCTVLCRAEGVNARLALAAESAERNGTRMLIRSGSREVQIQYPPAEIHRRWQGDEDYRDAYERWRAQRSAEAGGRWHGGWPASSGQEDPP